MEAAAAAASRRAPCFVSPHSNGSDVAHRNRRSVPAVRLRPWRDGGRMRPRHPNANPRTCHQSARDRISQRQLRLSPSRSCISIRPCLNVKKAVTALPWSSLCLEPKTHGAAPNDTPCAHFQYILNQNQTFIKTLDNDIMSHSVFSIHTCKHTYFMSDVKALHYSMW